MSYRLPYATWGQRVLAQLVDLALCVPFFVVAIAGVVVVVLNTSVDPVTDELHVGVHVLTGIGLVVLGYVAGAGFQIWNQVLRQGRTGASLGKEWLSIRVVSEETGAPLGALMTFVRHLAHLVDSATYVGYLWPLWDQKRQTFADKIMRTVVLHVPEVGPPDQP